MSVNPAILECQPSSQSFWVSMRSASSLALTITPPLPPFTARGRVGCCSFVVVSPSGTACLPICRPGCTWQFLANSCNWSRLAPSVSISRPATMHWLPCSVSVRRLRPAPPLKGAWPGANSCPILLSVAGFFACRYSCSGCGGLAYQSLLFPFLFLAGLTPCPSWHAISVQVRAYSLRLTDFSGPAQRNPCLVPCRVQLPRYVRWVLPVWLQLILLPS